jgi:hypothetical protein
VISISGRRNYHYLLSGLVLEETWDSKVAEFGAINITGFRNRHLENLYFFRSFSGKISRYIFEQVVELKWNTAGLEFDKNRTNWTTEDTFGLLRRRSNTCYKLLASCVLGGGGCRATENPTILPHIIIFKPYCLPSNWKKLCTVFKAAVLIAGLVSLLGRFAVSSTCWGKI